MAIKKNPLLQAFGIIIRRERLKRFWDYDALEKETDITANYLRSIEQGSYSIHISKALSFYTAFKKESLGNSFSFEGLMQLISLAGIIETYAQDKVRPLPKNDPLRDIEYARALAAAASLVSDNNPRVKKLFSKFFSAKIFEMETSDDVLLKLESGGILNEVEDFLLHFNDYGLSIADRNNIYLDGLSKDIPSIYLDAIYDFHSNVSKFTRYIFHDDFNEWLKRNENRIQEAYIIIRRFKRVHTQNFVRAYHFGFLWKTSFESLQLHILEQDGDRPKINDAFTEAFQNQFSHRYEEENGPTFNSGFDKIHFKNRDDGQTVCDSFMSLLKLDYDVEMFFVFKVMYLNYVILFKRDGKDHYQVLTVSEITKGMKILHNLVKQNDTKSVR